MAPFAAAEQLECAASRDAEAFREACERLGPSGAPHPPLRFTGSPGATGRAASGAGPGDSARPLLHPPQQPVLAAVPQGELPVPRAVASAAEPPRTVLAEAPLEVRHPPPRLLSPRLAGGSASRVIYARSSSARPGRASLAPAAAAAAAAAPPPVASAEARAPRPDLASGGRLVSLLRPSANPPGAPPAQSPAAAVAAVVSALLDAAAGAAGCGISDLSDAATQRSHRDRQRALQLSAALSNVQAQGETLRALLRTSSQAGSGRGRMALYDEFAAGGPCVLSRALENLRFALLEVESAVAAAETRFLSA